ncbi:hypothetical protein ABIC03_002211 [Bradyrhizobium sp. RT6a]
MLLCRRLFAGPVLLAAFARWLRFVALTPTCLLDFIISQSSDPLYREDHGLNPRLPRLGDATVTDPEDTTGPATTAQ